jgi:hypothetical protein
MDVRRKIAMAASAVTVVALAFEWLAVADSLASDQVEDPRTRRPGRRARRT